MGFARKMPPTGLEHARQYSTSHDRGIRAAPGAALGRNSHLIDAGLSEVIDAWPPLPEAVRADLLAKVRSAEGAG